MNELISKESLLKEIDELIAQYNWKDDGIIMDTLDCVRDMTFDHPTAYDIDKVVEEVKHLIAFEFNWLRAIMDEEGRITYGSLDIAEQGMREILRLIKKGGVEDD